MSSITYNFLPKEKARAKLKYYTNCYVKKEDIILAVIAPSIVSRKPQFIPPTNFNNQRAK